MLLKGGFYKSGLALAVKLTCFKSLMQQLYIAFIGCNKLLY